MPTKELKEEDDVNPKNRYSRDGLLAFLDDLKNDIGKGAEWSREFEPRIPDSDEAPGLAELFDRAGLDIAAPGHWQLLLVAISNAIHPEWSGRRIEWQKMRSLFMNRMCELARANPGSARETLCQMFKDERPADEHWPAVVTLREKCQKILQEARQLVADRKASDEEVAWVRQFTD